MKKLVRLNCALEKKEEKDSTEVWVYCGDIEIELVLYFNFIELADEEALNETFSDIAKSYNNECLRYIYQDYDVLYHFPVKSTRNVRKQYEINLKKQSKKIINSYANS